MTTKVENSIVVDAPVRTVYNQWTQFEDFPKFMGGVLAVQQLGDRNLHWVAEIAGVRREWDAVILEQVPDVKIAWAATEGATNAGVVYFQPQEAGRTTVRLSLEYEPTGLLEHLGDKLNVIERQAKADLDSFKKFIEDEGRATGTWRGTIDEGAGANPGVAAAEATLHDDGKAGVSPKAVVAGAAVATAGVIAARALRSDKDSGPAIADVDADHEADKVTVVDEVMVVEEMPTSKADDVAGTRGTLNAAGYEDRMPPV